MQIAACRDLWLLHDGRTEPLWYFLVAVAIGSTLGGYPADSTLVRIAFAVVRTECGLHRGRIPIATSDAAALALGRSRVTTGLAFTAAIAAAAATTVTLR